MGRYRFILSESYIGHLISMFLQNGDSFQLIKIATVKDDTLGVNRNVYSIAGVDHLTISIIYTDGQYQLFVDEKDMEYLILKHSGKANKSTSLFEHGKSIDALEKMIYDFYHTALIRSEKSAPVT